MGGGRTSVYVSVEDALKNDAFPDFLEVQKRSFQVTTNRSLVPVYVEEKETCMKLSQMQRDEKRVVFQNIYGEPFNYTREHYYNNGIFRNAYFSHKDADAMYQLILNNNNSISHTFKKPYPPCPSYPSETACIPLRI